jgi:hypothetical protein
MNDKYIVTVYVVIDELLKAHGVEDNKRASSGPEVTVGIVAAKYFQNHHEQAVCMMIRLSYIHGLGVSRFNRRLHALKDWLYGMVSVLTELLRQADVFIIDSMLLPVCKRARATRCKKVRGKAYCSYCAAKREGFFGWPCWLPIPAEIQHSTRKERDAFSGQTPSEHIFFIDARQAER